MSLCVCVSFIGTFPIWVFFPSIQHEIGILVNNKSQHWPRLNVFVKWQNEKPASTVGKSNHMKNSAFHVQCLSVAMRCNSKWIWFIAHRHQLNATDDDNNNNSKNTKTRVKSKMWFWACVKNSNWNNGFYWYLVFACEFGKVRFEWIVVELTPSSVTGVSALVIIA